jgi:hypothetical protein
VASSIGHSRGLRHGRAVFDRRLGSWSAFAVFLIGVIYIAALALGFATHGLEEPITDPLLAVMEVLTILSAMALLVMMAAIHSFASMERKICGSIALGFMTIVTGTTSAVHFVELTAARQLGTGSIVWPSTTYAVELLAWNLFLGLSLLFAAPIFEGDDLQRHVRRGLRISGALCVAGVLGPVVGNMRLQLVGVLGYAGILPLVCFILARLFRAAPQERM